MDDDLDLYDPLKSAGSLSLEEMIENDIRTQSSVDDFAVAADDDLADFDDVASSAVIGSPSSRFDSGLFGDANPNHLLQLPWFGVSLTNCQNTNGQHCLLDFDQSSYVLVNPSTVLPPLETAAAGETDDDELITVDGDNADDTSLIMVKPSLVERDDAITLVKLNRNLHKDNNNRGRRTAATAKNNRPAIGVVNREPLPNKDRSKVKSERHVPPYSNIVVAPPPSAMAVIGSSESSDDDDDDDDSDIDTIPTSIFSVGNHKAKTKVTSSSSSNRTSKNAVGPLGRSPSSNTRVESFAHAQLGERIFPKPAYSYSCLIAIALKNSETGSLPVSEIYSFMTETFPYFKTAPNGWKNSVRHNLSLNKSFEKIDKGVNTNQQRKGCLWGLNPEKADRMDEELLKWSRKDPMAIKNSMARPETLELLEKGCLKFDVDQNKMNSRKKTENPKTDTLKVPTFLTMEPAVVDCIDLESSSDSDDSLKEVSGIQDGDEMWRESEAKMDFEASMLSDNLSNSHDDLNLSCGVPFVNGKQLPRKSFVK